VQGFLALLKRTYRDRHLGVSGRATVTASNPHM